MATESPSTSRQAAAVASGLATGVLGALILGEYDMSGWTPFVAGVLFGLVVAEVILSVARRATTALLAAAMAISAGGYFWAAFISAGRVVSQIPGRAYLGLVLAVAVSAGWAIGPLGRRRAGA